MEIWEKKTVKKLKLCIKRNILLYNFYNNFNFKQLNMKTKLLFIVCLSIMALNVSAQDTLKVNFKPAGTPGSEGWDSILVSDKTLYSDGYYDFDAFGTTISVKPEWLNSPNDVNIRSIDRGSYLSQYVGPMADVLRSYTAVDSRYANDCDVISIEITGLPEGTYTFNSYHHDFNDQYGNFTVETGVNGDIVDADISGKMISHSLSLASFEATYGEAPVSVDYESYYVRASLDSVTQYTYDQIVSTGTSDIVTVNFKNFLPPSKDMNHSLKFALINGFKLYISPPTSIENNQIANQNIEIINRNNGNVTISGERMTEISLYSIAGTLIKQVTYLGDQIELTDLHQGIYIAKVSFNNGNSISRKIVVH